MNVMIRSCCEVIESGRTMSMPGIHQEVMERWLGRYYYMLLYYCLNSDIKLLKPFRYFDVVLHLKPHALQHPLEFWKHTAFVDKAEYDEFNTSGKNLGKSSARNPLCGMKQKYHEFADKIWNKWKLTRRDIANCVQAPWKILVPNNQLPSGIKLAEIVDLLRLEIFKKWLSRSPFALNFMGGLLEVGSTAERIS
jgi:hypothetical protein